VGPEEPVQRGRQPPSGSRAVQPQHRRHADRAEAEPERAQSMDAAREQQVAAAALAGRRGEAGTAGVNGLRFG